jgi:hypothetical protein
MTFDQLRSEIIQVQGGGLSRCGHRRLTTTQYMDYFTSNLSNCHLAKTLVLPYADNHRLKKICHRNILKYGLFDNHQQNVVVSQLFI